MVVEFTRLGAGLLILLFHRPIADYILSQERALVAAFRQRGMALPAAPSTEMGRNIYFGIGMFVACFQMAKIWLALRG
jgi:uncharacterized membrane protein (DUF485 family)